MDLDEVYPDPSSIKKERETGPQRSHLFLAAKKVVILSVCVSTLAINVALLSEVCFKTTLFGSGRFLPPSSLQVLDYLNATDFKSMASGIIMGLSLCSILFELIGNCCAITQMRPVTNSCI